MSAVVMMFIGGGVGMGFLLFAQALRPQSRPIHEVFRSVSGAGASYHMDPGIGAQTTREKVANVGVHLAKLTNDEADLAKDLAVTNSTLEQHGIIKLTGPAVTIGAIYMLWAGLAAVGVVVSPFVTAVTAICAALLAFVIPDVRLRARARERRVAFRYALSAYLDLVTIIMSGGGGLLTALQSAADAGDGWAFAEIRAALDRARLSNRTPWSQLGVLSDRFDIPDLRDLVAAADLAGSEGSRITDSVATKSDVLRARLQAEVEQTSESLTEQMLIPVGLLLVALFMFLGFAVFQQVGAGSQPDLQGQVIGLLR